MTSRQGANWLGDELHAVVIPDRWFGVIPVSIENADREGFWHDRACLRFLYPAEPGGFRVLSQGAASWAASEDQGYDSV
jgi:hypothetical protein